MQLSKTMVRYMPCTSFLSNFLLLCFIALSSFPVNGVLICFLGFVAGETEIVKKLREIEKEEERLVLFSVDVLDYHSILVALKGCSALFASLDSSDNYDVSLTLP